MALHADMLIGLEIMFMYGYFLKKCPTFTFQAAIYTFNNLLYWLEDIFTSEFTFS